MMTIRKKSPDTLKQQKSSFLNYIKNKEKYSEAIADLFLDDELEKIDDVESVKQHLEEKGISKELIDSLEADYQSYLRGQSFYGPIDDYPEDIKELIKENDKILSKIKEDIIKEYEKNKEFMSLDIYKFIENNFGTFDEENFKNIRKEISKLEDEIKELKEKIELNEELIKNLENEYGKLSIIKFSKKKEIKQKIEDKKNENIEIQEKIKRKEEEHKTKNKRECTIDNLWRIDNINNFIGQKKRTNLAECKKSLGEIREEMSEYLNYIPEETFKHIVGVLYEKISDEKNIKKEKLKKMIDEYLNYFFTGENRYMGYIPTIYTKNKIDVKIMNIIKELGYNIHTDIEDKIDYDFIDDVFIHTTGFRVLDEILEEGGLVSTNEANKRGRNNEDIKNSITQKEEIKDEGAQPHKDIYFSRGFRRNLYGGEKKSDDDFVFIANTMSNFGNNGYGIPLNSQMQPDEYGETIKNAVEGDHDLRGYSIISKSAIEKNEQEDSYSKIDVKDVYIFVCETKKKEIEGNPKYKTQGTNIIYFPEKYKGEMSYELYEYIKNEIAKREEKSPQSTPIPNKIITSEDGIESIRKEYKWAFCTPKTTGQRILLNPIKNGDYKDIVNFLKRISQSEGGLIDSQRLENYLIENKNAIDDLKIKFKYPKELIILIISTLKIYKPVNWKIYSICKKIKEFGYSLKEVAILYETIGIIDSLLIHKEIWDEDMKRIIEWCDNWGIDVKQMENFIVKILNIAVEKKYADFFRKKFDDYRKKVSSK